MNLIVPLNIADKKSWQLKLSYLNKKLIEVSHKENVTVKNRDGIKTFGVQSESCEIIKNKRDQNNNCHNIVLDSV